MTAPEDPNGLREALASVIRRSVRGKMGIDHGLIQALVDSPERITDAIIAGPLARALAAEAERDEEQQESARLALLLTTAEAEITRLKEGMEAALRPFAEAIDDRERRAALVAAARGQMAIDDTDVAYVELGLLRAARSTLATLSPKEHP